MNAKNILLTGSAVLITAVAALAQDSKTWDERFRYAHDGMELYPAQELTLDLFAAYTDVRRKFNDTFDRSYRHGNWGGGLGLNYFPARNFGLGVDAFAQDNGKEFVDAASASAILRLPLDIVHLAPYGFGGGGYNFQGTDSWTAHVGVGLEFRLNSGTGIFVDGRHVFAERSSLSDFALIRTGLRLAF